MVPRIQRSQNQCSRSLSQPKVTHSKSKPQESVCVLDQVERGDRHFRNCRRKPCIEYSDDRPRRSSEKLSRQPAGHKVPAPEVSPHHTVRFTTQVCACSDDGVHRASLQRHNMSHSPYTNPIKGTSKRGRGKPKNDKRKNPTSLYLPATPPTIKDTHNAKYLYKKHSMPTLPSPATPRPSGSACEFVHVHDTAFSARLYLHPACMLLDLCAPKKPVT